MSERPSLPAEVLERFGRALADAAAGGEPEPTAMVVSTRALGGGVASRTVLLKEHDASGFVFFTNTRSNKGRQLAADPAVAALFLWKAIEHQVKIEGMAEPVTAAEADAYFASRARGSQLGAWASRQSEPLESRAALIAEVERLEGEYDGRDVPRPPHWSGYRIRPHMVEFWYGREYRLHDRFRFTVEDGKWVRRRLYP